jgi:hypothetical protein
MAGLYGTVRSAKIDPLKDAELFYFYRPNRSTTDEDFSQFKKLSPSNLVSCKGDVDSTLGVEDVLPGMFNLRLPLDTFNDTGIYTIYIRPREYVTNLLDVSVLADYPEIRGVVINKNSVSGVTDLTGYRIEYFDTTVNPAVRTERAFIITSCNFCKPIWVSVSDSVNIPKRYQYTDSSSNLLFCTLTPCSYGDYSPNVAPNIGTGVEEKDKVAIINTKFSPVMIEVEMVEHDAETITTMLEGDTIMDHDNAIMTHYNENKEIYQQYDFYEQKNSLGEPLYTVKRKRENIDSSEDYDNIVE